MNGEIRAAIYGWSALVAGVFSVLWHSWTMLVTAALFAAWAMYALEDHGVAPIDQ